MKSHFCFKLRFFTGGGPNSVLNPASILGGPSSIGSASISMMGSSGSGVVLGTNPCSSIGGTGPNSVLGGAGPNSILTGSMLGQTGGPGQPAFIDGVLIFINSKPGRGTKLHILALSMLLFNAFWK